MKYKDKFDVEEARNGRLCLTRDGREVLIVWDTSTMGADETYPLKGYVKNVSGWQPSPTSWMADGSFWDHDPYSDGDIVAMSDKWFEYSLFTPVETVSFDGRIVHIIFDERIVGSARDWRFFGVIDGFDGCPHYVHWNELGQCSLNPPEGGDISPKLLKLSNEGVKHEQNQIRLNASKN